MTIIDRIREALEVLAYRSPVVITIKKHRWARERNASILGVDWGTYRVRDRLAEQFPDLEVSVEERDGKLYVKAVAA